MSSRWKKVWSDFWGNKSRTLLTILTILVGTFAVGFVSNMNLYLLESLDSDYLSSQPSEGTISAYPLDDDMVRMAREVPGVDAVEGIAMVGADLIQPGQQPLTMIFTGLKDPATLTVNQIKPAPGETNLPRIGEKEVLIDSSAASLGYQPGDTLVVELGNGKRRELRVVGYTHDVNAPPYALGRVVSGYVTPDTLEWLGGPPNYSQLAVSVAENQTDVAHVTEVTQAVADRVEHAGATIYFVNVYQPGHHSAWRSMQAVFFLLSVFGYMTVLLSVFLVINTITALMTQQTRQIGIMKSVGGGTVQVTIMYLALVFGFGVVALLLAVPLANLAAEKIGAGMASFINILPIPFKTYLPTVAQQAIVSLVVPILAALLPIFNSVRMTVREAISDYGIGGKVSPKGKQVRRSAVLFPRPIRLSLRNVFRRKARLTLTLFTLVLGGAIFIAVYNLRESFDKAIKDVQGYFLSDVNISFPRYYRFDEVASLAEGVPGVSSVEGWTEVEGTLITSRETVGRQIMFVAPPSTSTLIDPLIIAGRWLKTGDENAVVIGNHLLTEYPDLKVGDWLTVDIDDKETKWHIVGIYTIVGNTNPPLLYTNYEYISRLVGRPGQVYSLRVLTDQHDEAFQKGVSEKLQAVYKEHGVQVASAGLGSDFITANKRITDIVVYMMMVMASLIAIVGAIGLTGTMSINVLERTREIGVMRAIGASNWDIQTIVIVEGMVIGVISWLVSILISIPITFILCYGVGVGLLTAPMKPVYGITGIIMWLILTLILASIASALPARRASRLTVRDTLAYE
ncbi:MAG TPA: FtsX-like permease family protein [Anaerolineales bacterium]|nr:FtsX-like permease family protein [Anaerolineales bacterium]